MVERSRSISIVLEKKEKMLDFILFNVSVSFVYTVFHLFITEMHYKYKFTVMGMYMEKNKEGLEKVKKICVGIVSRLCIIIIGLIGYVYMQFPSIGVFAYGLTWVIISMIILCSSFIGEKTINRIIVKLFLKTGYLRYWELIPIIMYYGILLMMLLINAISLIIVDVVSFGYLVNESDFLFLVERFFQWHLMEVSLEGGLYVKEKSLLDNSKNYMVKNSDDGMSNNRTEVSGTGAAKDKEPVPVESVNIIRKCCRYIIKLLFGEEKGITKNNKENKEHNVKFDEQKENNIREKTNKDNKVPVSDKKDTVESVGRFRKFIRSIKKFLFGSELIPGAEIPEKKDNVGLIQDNVKGKKIETGIIDEANKNFVKEEISKNTISENEVVNKDKGKGKVDENGTTKLGSTELIMPKNYKENVAELRKGFVNENTSLYNNNEEVKKHDDIHLLEISGLKEELEKEAKRGIAEFRSRLTVVFNYVKEHGEYPDMAEVREYSNVTRGKIYDKIKQISIARVDAGEDSDKVRTEMSVEGRKIVERFEDEERGCLRLCDHIMEQNRKK